MGEQRSTPGVSKKLGTSGEGVSEKRRGRGTLETLATQNKKLFNIVNFAALFILALGTGLSYNC